MSDRFNPDLTGIVGLEWFPTTVPSTSLASSRDSLAIVSQCTVAEVCAFAYIYANAVPQAGAVVLANVFAGTVVPTPGAVSIATAVPNEDISGGGAGVGQWSNIGTTNLWQAIDETVAAGSGFDNTDWMEAAPAGGVLSTRYYGRMTTGASSMAGRRIAKIRQEMGVFGASVVVRYGLRIGGIDYSAASMFPTTITTGVTGYFDWMFNPATGRPWTPADWAAFDTTDGWWCDVINSVPFSPGYVYAADMLAYHTAEDRLAISGNANIVPGINAFAMVTPTGGAWTKPGTGYCTFEFHRGNDTGQIVLPALDSGKVIPACWAYQPSIDPATGLMALLGPQLTRAPLILLHTGGAASIDSQPYQPSIGAAPISVGVTAEQEHSAQASTDYVLVQVLVQPGNADLAIKLKRRSDNVQLGGTITVTAAQVAALPDQGNGWKLLTVRHSPAATLVAGVQYYREFSSAATSPWVVSYLGAFAGWEFASAGAQVDVATLGGVENTAFDIATTIRTVALDPPTPAGFTATLMQRTVDKTLCGITKVDFARLAWTATASGRFAYYTVQSSSDAGVTWQDRERIDTQSVVTIDVGELPRGRATCFRVAMVDTDGIASPWSSSVCVTPQMYCHELVITSDKLPGLTVAYDYDEKVEYVPGDGSSTLAVYGKDYGLGFVETERPAPKVRWTLKVGVTDLAPPPGGGAGYDAFAPLLAIIRAQGILIPYVAVCDRRGMVWRGVLRVVGTMTEEGRSDRYIAQIELEHLYDSPFAAELTLV